MILTTLKSQAELQKDKTAISDGTDYISYREMYKQVLLFSTSLLDLITANGNEPVAVLIDRNIESLVSFFAVATTGNFYVPIDITQPVQRINLILSTLEPVLIVNATKRPQPDLPDNSVPICNYDTLIDQNQKLMQYEIGNLIPTSFEAVLFQIEKNIIDTDPLYAMFTSGSTGVPKGALISYRAISDLTKQFQKEFQFSAEDVFGNQAPFDFDVSVKDIYCALNIGATIVIIPRVNFSFPAKLMSFLNQHEITIGIWSVSVLRIVENLKGLAKETPKHLKQLMFSGEVMPNKVLNYWRHHMPDTRFVNLYGPTEITCNCSFYIVDREFEDDEPLPIGKPFDNTRIIVLDDNKNLVSGPNQQGELCVIGSSLALGYYNNPATTAEAFVQNPLNTTYDETIYRTGDIAYYNYEGLLMFLSRKDHQIKHMGHRIELGEIESNSNALPMIDASVCIYDKQAEKIVMFYQAKEEANKEIYIQMLKKLPKYMVPNKMIHYKNLPLNKNGKIDRIKLAEDYYADSH